jgi:hypothetical protein
MKISEDCGLYKVKIGSKIVYFDTNEDIARLAEMAESGLSVVEDSSDQKKKVAEIDATIDNSNIVSEQNPMANLLSHMDFSGLMPNEIKAEIQKVITHLHAGGEKRWNSNQLMAFASEYLVKHGMEPMVPKKYEFIEGIEDGSLQRDMDKHM